MCRMVIGKTFFEKEKETGDNLSRDFFLRLNYFEALSLSVRADFFLAALFL